MWKVFLFLAVVFTYLTLVWGGLVRSTDSGLACPEWPLCYGNFTPPKEFSAKLEMGHRTISGLAGIFVLLTFVYVWKHFKGSTRLAALFSVVFTFSAALTGMKMIRLETPELKYVSHMLLESFHIYESMIVLGSLVLTYRLASNYRPEGGVPIWVYALALTTMITGVLVRYTGSGHVCGPEWPTCNGLLIPDLTNWQVALHFAHRNIAYLTWLGFLVYFLTTKSRIAALSFAFINMQFVFAIGIVISDFFLPIVFLDIAMGFFLFGWLTYNLQIGRSYSYQLRTA